MTTAPLVMPTTCRNQPCNSLPACVVGAATRWWRQQGHNWVSALPSPAGGCTYARIALRVLLLKPPKQNVPAQHIPPIRQPPHEAHTLTMTLLQCCQRVGQVRQQGGGDSRHTCCRRCSPPAGGCTCACATLRTLVVCKAYKAHIWSTAHPSHTSTTACSTSPSKWLAAVLPACVVGAATRR
jgi:hypothetical protein